MLGRVPILQKSLVLLAVALSTPALAQEKKKAPSTPSDSAAQTVPQAPPTQDAADQPQTPSAQTQAPASTPEPKFDHKVYAFTGGAEAGWGQYGYKLLGTLGGRYDRLTTSDDHKFVFRYGGSAQGLSGAVANTKPYDTVGGARARVHGEAGVRDGDPKQSLQAYASVSNEAEGRIVADNKAPITELYKANNLDGLGGTALSDKSRLNVGISLAEADRMLSLVTYIQEELTSKQTNTPATAYTGTGARLQVDFPGVIFGGEGTIEWRDEKNDALGTKTKYSRWMLAADFIKYWKHWQVGGSVSVGRDGATTYTAGSALEFDVAKAPAATLTLEAGWTP